MIGTRSLLALLIVTFLSCQSSDPVKTTGDGGAATGGTKKTDGVGSTSGTAENGTGNGTGNGGDEESGDLIVFNRNLILSQVIDTVTVTNGASIWTVDPANPANLQEILSGAQGSNIMPSWGPNQQKIVFASNRGRSFNGDPSPFLDIYSMNADGSNIIRLTTADAHDWTPAFSPDGSKIAFASTRNGANKDSVQSFDIFVMNADGSNQINLTANTGSGQEEDPIISKNGQTIYYINADLEIWKVSVTGNPPPSPLCNNQSISGEDISLSPDGSRLYFFSNNTGMGSVTLNTCIVTPLGSGLEEPWISSDGTRFVFMNGSDLFSILSNAINNSAPSRLTNIGDAYFPRWSPP